MFSQSCRWLFYLLAALLAGAPSAHAQESQREVRKISFEGAHNFDDELLRAAIVSNPTSCTFFVVCARSYVDDTSLRGDLVRLRLFYFQRGYRNASVTLDT